MDCNIAMICLGGIAHLMIGSVVAGIEQTVNRDKMKDWDDEDISFEEFLCTILWPFYLVGFVCSAITKGVKRLLQ